MEENNSDKALREKATQRIAAAEPETPRGAADGPEKPAQDAVVRPHGPATPRFRFPSVGDLLALLGVFVVCQLVAWVVSLLCGVRMPDAGGAPLTPEQQQQTGVFVAVNYAVSMTLMILATLLYRRLRGGTHRIARFSLRGFNPAILLWGLVMMLAASIVIDPLLALLPAPPDATGRGLWALVTVVVLAPVLEELLCRGILLESLRARYGVITALWASSLFFAVMHLHVTLAVNALVLGLILGFIYLRTDSLYATILLHGFNNAIAMTLLLFGMESLTLSELLPNRTLYACVYVLAMAVFALAAWRMMSRVRLLREQEKNRPAA